MLRSVSVELAELVIPEASPGGNGRGGSVIGRGAIAEPKTQAMFERLSRQNR
jgi:hypothetical protein